MSNFIRFPFGLALLIPLACVKTLSFQMPNHHFSVPDRAQSLSTGDKKSESGKEGFLKGFASLALQESKKVSVARAYDSIVFSNFLNGIESVADMGDTKALSTNANIALVEKLDFIGEFSLSFGANLGLKYQIIAPEYDILGGLMASVQVHSGFQTDSLSFSVTPKDKPPRTYDGTLRVSSLGSVLSVGYPIFSKSIAYFSIFGDRYLVNASMKSNIDRIDVKGMASNFSYNFGLKVSFKERALLFAELGQATASYQHSSKSQTMPTGALGVGLSF